MQARTILFTFLLAASQLSAITGDDKVVDVETIKTAMKPWPELKLSAGAAYRVLNYVMIDLDTIPANRIITIPRLNNPLKSGVVFMQDSKADVAVQPQLTTWNLVLPKKSQGPAFIVLEMVGEPILAAEPFVIEQTPGETIVLPAHHAAITGTKLRYEPQPHKNTVGYWTNPADVPSWTFRVASPGDYAVILQQGCGKGQGGSEVNLEGADQTLRFVVEDTGHFQNFKYREVGHVRFAEPGTYTLAIKPQKKAKAAIMDVRSVRLSPC